MEKLQKFAKKLKYVCPQDIYYLSLWSISISFLLLCFSTKIPLFLMFLLSLYITLNIIIAGLWHGRYRYVLLFTPFFRKKEVFISIENCIWNKPNIGNRKYKGTKKLSIFLKELEQLCETLPVGTVCHCSTHEVFINQLKKYASDITMEKAYMSSLKTVCKIVGTTTDGEDKQFYRVRFVIRHPPETN